MDKSGIYVCECMISDGIYIGKTGSTCGFHKRWNQEKRRLNHNNCWNKHWQNSWNKYGSNNFEFRILEECCDEVLNQREIAWIKYYREAGRNVYNHTDGGDGQSKGFKHSEETKRKISESNKGKHDYLKNGIMLGKHHTKETKEKLRIVNVGKRLSEETKEKISQNSKSGTKETRNKIRLAHIGKKLSEEHKNSLSKSLKGRIFSEEHRRKLSKSAMGNKNGLNGKASLGYKHTKEETEKISNASKNMWIRIKQGV